MGILQGWVSTFRDRYRKHLGREIGRIPEGKRIWIDYEQLRGNDLVTPKTSDDLKDSALLIPILSKSWFASRWCRQEFTTFIAHHSNWQERLFPVWMEPVGSDDLVNNEDARVIWNRLQGPEGLLDYQFWYRDQANQPRTRWFPFVDSTDRGYINTQQDMARDMAERLMQLGQLARVNKPRAHHARSEPAFGDLRPAHTPLPRPQPGHDQWWQQRCLIGPGNRPYPGLL